MCHWLKPPLVQAPSAIDKNKIVKYRISNEFFEKNAYINRRTPIFQIWAHVIGEFPPINNISYLKNNPPFPTISTLLDSVACFRGVKRPCDGENNGDSILTYVLNPSVSIAYEPSSVCVAKAVRLGTSMAATVQVKATEPLQIDDETVSGTVTRIEFVRSAPGTPLLPENYQERYSERLW